MALNKYDCLLFDIGGVLAELCSAPKILEWMGNRVSYEEMRIVWTHSDAVRNYEKGLITSEDFAKRVVEELQFNISAERFLGEFVLFIKCLYPGVPEVLKDLEKEYVTATLSNTNELHWDRLCNEFGFDKIIERNILSFRIGLMKPDPEIYRYAISKLSCEPSRILFFDDSRINVEAARNAGIDAIQVSGFADVKQKLFEIGIIEKHE
ncbi:MAG TPA: HAD family phosphatase [Clostridia bacterium]